MFFNNYVNLIFRNLINIPGSRFGKIVIFLSDDWGCLRHASVWSREQLIKQGFNLNSNRFDRYDCLESNEDLEHLFEVLLKYKDHKGNHPVITALTNVANPDFTAIRASGFSRYSYETIPETFNRYPGRDKVLQYYMQGIENRIFIPQFHGREHLHIKRWMIYLQDEAGIARNAFRHEFFLLGRSQLPANQLGLGAAFDLDSLDELEAQEAILKDGLDLFEQVFSYRSRYFTAPSGIYHSGLEKCLSEEGVSLIDVPRYRKMPVGENRTKTKLHYLGQKNRLGQFYITRNAVFEPNMYSDNDGVDSCLSDIELAFRWHKPAVISNHRAAFAGELTQQTGPGHLKHSRTCWLQF